MAADTLADIRMSYDALNRLRTRNVPPAHYDARLEGIAALGSDKLEVNGGNRAYPWYPSPGTTGFVVPAEVATFDYDESGNLVRADNPDALVRRVYNPNGSLKTETQKIRTLAALSAGGDTTTHVYSVGYHYDLNGRRTAIDHPHRLTPTPFGRSGTTYSYDPLTGAPADVYDVLGNRFTYGYNARGEVTTLALAGGVTEAYGYDQDGNRATHRTTSSGGGVFRNETRDHDPRGKVLTTTNTAGYRDALTARYSGLGHVVATSFAQDGRDEHGNAVRFSSTESFRQDALANVYSSSYTSNYSRGFGGTSWWGFKDANGTWSGGSAGFQFGTGRLMHTQNGLIRDEYRYDSAGNTIFTTRPTGTEKRDRASYYGADGTLRAADYRTATIGGDPATAPFHATFEEYRYDALGRRVWVRSRRQCQGVVPPSECDISTVRRTVWDGSQEL